jgi:hypothetical protein
MSGFSGHPDCVPTAFPLRCGNAVRQPSDCVPGLRSSRNEVSGADPGVITPMSPRNAVTSPPTLRPYQREARDQYAAAARERA